MLWFESFNAFLWVYGNVLLAGLTVVGGVFVVAYPLLFDPRATTAGRLILRTLTGLTGVVLLAFLGTWVDGRAEPWVMPVEVAVWRPVVRAFLYSYALFGLVSLCWLLVVRKWFPSRMRSAPEDTLNVRLRARK